MARKFVLNAQLHLIPPSNTTQIVSQLKLALAGINAGINLKVNNIGQVQSQVNNVAKHITQSGKAAKGATNEFEALGASAARALRRYSAFTIVVSSVLKLTSAISSSVGEAIKFDREVIRIQQVSGGSASSVKELADEVARLSKTFGTNSTELISVASTLVQAGLSAKDTKTALEALAKTSVSATFGSIKETTEASIAIFQQFGVEAKDLESVLGSVNRVSAAFAIESEDIAVAVRRSGGAFQAAGGSLNEFISLLTSVRQTTRESAESIATGFRTIFTRLQRLSTQKFFHNLGIELTDVNHQFIGPYESIRRISEALKDISTADPRFSQIVEELGGFRQVSKVVPLLTQFGVSEKALSIALRGGNSLTEDAATAQGALQIKLQKVKEEFADLIRSFANNDWLKGFIADVLSLTKSLVHLVKAFEPLIPILATVGTAAAFGKVADFSKGFFGSHIAPGIGAAATKGGKLALGTATGNAVKFAGTNPLGVAISGHFLTSFASQLTGATSEVTKFSHQLAEGAVKFAVLNSITGGIRESLRSRTDLGGFTQRGFARQDTFGLGRRGSRNLFQGASIAGGIVGIAAAGFGDSLSEQSSKEIAAGGTSIGKGVAGSLLTSAGTGAALGAAFGPWGIAIGAAAGATYALTTSFSRLRKEVESVKLNKSLETLSNTLEQFSKGRLTTAEVGGSLLPGLKQNLSLFATGTPDDKKNISATFKQHESIIDQFFNTIARGSESLGDFNKQTDNGLVAYAAITHTSLPLLQAHIKKVIEASKLETDTSKRLTEEQEKQIRSIQNLIVVQEGFANLANTIEKVGGRLDDIFSVALNGKTGDFTGSTNLFKQASEGKLSISATKNPIETAGKNILSAMGIENKDLLDELSQSAIILKELPNIIVNFKRNADLMGGETEDLAEKFVHASAAFLPGGVINDTVSNSLKTAIRQNVEGRDENASKAVEVFKDSAEAASKIAPILRPIINTFGEAKDALDAKTEFLQGEYNKQNQLEIRRTELLVDNLTRLQEFTQQVEDFRGENPQTFRGAVGNLQARANLIAGQDVGQTDFKSVIELLSQRAIGLNSQIRSPKTNEGDRERFIAELAGVNQSLERFKKTVDLLSNDQTALSAGFKQLDEIFRQNSLRKQLATTAVFGSVDERQETGKVLLDLVTALKNPRGLGAVPVNNRGALLDLIKSNPKSVVAGKPLIEHGIDLAFKEGKFNNQFARPKDRATDEQLLDQAKLIFDSPIAQQEKLIDEMKAFVTGQAKLNTDLGNTLRGASTDIGQTLINANKLFLQELREIFKVNEKGNIDVQVGSNDKKIEDLVVIAKQFQKYADVFGTGEREDIVAKLQKQIGVVTEVSSINERIKELQNPEIATLAKQINVGAINKGVAGDIFADNKDRLYAKTKVDNAKIAVQKLLSLVPELAGKQKELESLNINEVYKLLEGLKLSLQTKQSDAGIGSTRLPSGVLANEETAKEFIKASQDFITSSKGFKNTKDVVRQIEKLNDTNFNLQESSDKLKDSIDELRNSIDTLKRGVGMEVAQNKRGVRIQDGPKFAGAGGPKGAINVHGQMAIAGVSLLARPKPTTGPDFTGIRMSSFREAQRIFPNMTAKEYKEAVKNTKAINRNRPPADIPADASRPKGFGIVAKRPRKSAAQVRAESEARKMAKKMVNIPIDALLADEPMATVNPNAGDANLPNPFEDGGDITSISIEDALRRHGIQNSPADALDAIPKIPGLKGSGRFENPSGKQASEMMRSIFDKQNAISKMSPEEVERATAENNRKLESFEAGVRAQEADRQRGMGMLNGLITTPNLGGSQSTLKTGHTRIDTSIKSTIGPPQPLQIKSGRPLSTGVPEKAFNNVNINGLGKLDNIINQMNSGVDRLTSALGKIPSIIEMAGTHKVEVIINGSEAFTKMEPQFASFVHNEIVKSMNKFIDYNAPNLSRMV